MGSFGMDAGKEMKECPHHGQYESSKTGSILGTIFYTRCPLCDAEDEIEIVQERARIESEWQKQNLLRMNIEPEFNSATFENYECPSAEYNYNCARVQLLVAGSIMKIVMTGKNGTGKTHLACAALKLLGGKIMTMYEISTAIRASYTAKCERSEIEIVDQYARLPLFVIDEIGRTKGGDAEANWLSYIIDKRHVRKLPTILISNKHTRKDCEKKGCPDCLENYIGEDIMSRLNDNGVLLRFNGEDWRKRK